MELKFGTFNIRVDLPQDGKDSWKHRTDKVPELILKHHPHVIGLQEALLPMIKDVETALPEYQWIGEGRRGGMSDEFCPILYNYHKLFPMESGQFWLSKQPDEPNSISWDSDFPRICTWAHFQVKHESRHEFIVYNTHLDHISEAARENGIALVWDRIQSDAAKKNVPAMLMGDLNSHPDEQPVRFLRGEASLNGLTAKLKDSFTAIDGSPGRTFHQFKGGMDGEPIDYIFFTQEVKVLKTEVDRHTVNGRYPSDHYPVFTTIEL
ncbi:endonuclease/exonuclease/phosphatase family protein [Halobacillus sp. B23F22_1]|uniref:endonuclease/exonuclease/phosphatase family protein n=1 Tax=Halobacillus sp. B23F22_1 TaxID=3459514 RepID=UPI00373F02D4